MKEVFRERLTEDDVRYIFTKLELANLKNCIEIKEKHEASAGYSERMAACGAKQHLRVRADMGRF